MSKRPRKRTDPEIIEKIFAAKSEATKKEMQCAFGFARISSKQQNEGVSLEEQTSRIQQYAEREGLLLAHIWEVVETAYKAEKRHEFHEMLNLCERLEIKHLIFKDTDRASRNYKDVVRLEELCKEHHVTRHYYDSNQKIGPESHYSEELSEDIKGAFAKFHSAQSSHKIKSANLHTAEQGKAPGSTPWGYRRNDKKEIVIDTNIAPRLRWIFNEFDTGKYTISQFVELLNGKGVRTSNGARWSMGNLHRLLTNPFYAGRFRWSGAEHQGSHPPYVSRPQFDQRLVRLGERRNGQISKKNIYPLTRLLTCSDCGAILIGEYQRGRHKKGDYIYYKHPCQARHGRLVYYKQEQVLEWIDQEIARICFAPEFAEVLKILFRTGLASEG